MTTDRDPEAWAQCPLGMLKQMVGQIRVDQRREFLRTLAKGAAAALLLGAGGVMVAQWMGEDDGQPAAQLACGEVVKLLPDYVAHRLDGNLTQRVADHLAKCRGCRTHYEEMAS